MKKPEEILSDITGNNPDYINVKLCLKAMKLYANAKLDEAAATANIKNKENNDHWYECLPFPEVDKDSILSLKDKV